uniref:D-aspartate oxidase n=1 Tax=Anas platyrhynchos platyrhynchos TaxID=8840 RepID=A0A493TWE2_ANAPP
MIDLVAVVGAGLVGLSTALCISEAFPSCSLSVLAEQFSPNTTGDVAAGMLIPSLKPPPKTRCLSGLTSSWGFDPCPRRSCRSSLSTDGARPSPR